MMCNDKGGSPGFVVTLDPATGRTKPFFNSRLRYPEDVPTIFPMNPHGIDSKEQIHTLVISNYVVPSTILGNGTVGGPRFGDGLSVWNTLSRRITKSIFIEPNGGFMDVRFIPRDPEGRVYTTATVSHHVFLVDPRMGTFKDVYDLNTIGNVTFSSCLLRMDSLGTRLFASYGDRFLVMFDILVRDDVKLLDVYDLGVGAGTHYIDLHDSTQRLIAVGYFLDMDNFGIVHENGNRQALSFDVSTDKFVLETNFNVDFNKIPLKGRPHAAVIYDL